MPNKLIFSILSILALSCYGQSNDPIKGMWYYYDKQEGYSEIMVQDHVLIMSERNNALVVFEYRFEISNDSVIYLDKESGKRLFVMVKEPTKEIVMHTFHDNSSHKLNNIVDHGKEMVFIHSKSDENHISFYERKKEYYKSIGKKYETGEDMIIEMED